MGLRCLWILPPSCCLLFPWLMLSTSFGAVALPILIAFWRTRPMTLLAKAALCLPLVLWYETQPISIFSTFLSCMSYLLCANNRVYSAALVAGNPIDSSIIAWLVYAYRWDEVIRERAVERNPNVMGYPFLERTWAVSFLIVFLCTIFLLRLILTSPVREKAQQHGQTKVSKQEKAIEAKW